MVAIDADSKRGSNSGTFPSKFVLMNERVLCTKLPTTSLSSVFTFRSNSSNVKFVSFNSGRRLIRAYRQYSELSSSRASSIHTPMPLLFENFSPSNKKNSVDETCQGRLYESPDAINRPGNT